VSKWSAGGDRGVEATELVQKLMEEQPRGLRTSLRCSCVWLPSGAWHESQPGNGILSSPTESV